MQTPVARAAAIFSVVMLTGIALELAVIACMMARQHHVTALRVYDGNTCSGPCMIARPRP